MSVHTSEIVWVCTHVKRYLSASSWLIKTPGYQACCQADGMEHWVPFPEMSGPEICECIETILSFLIAGRSFSKSLLWMIPTRRGKLGMPSWQECSLQIIHNGLLPCKTLIVLHAVGLLLGRPKGRILPTKLEQGIQARRLRNHQTALVAIASTW